MSEPKVTWFPEKFSAGFKVFGGKVMSCHLTSPLGNIFYNFLKFSKQDITFIDKCLEKGNLLVKIGLPYVLLVV